MNKSLYSILFLLCIISGCGLDNQDEQPDAKGLPSVRIESNSRKTQSSPPAIFRGNPVQSIDFSGKTLFQDDGRIDDIHKKKFPRFNQKYVLWRLTHDGSCWVSSATTLLLYQMIEGGQKKFDDVVTKMRALAASGAQKSLEQDLTDFFAILEVMRNNLSHRFSLDLRNHQNIYEKLDHGMRALLAHFASNGGRTISEPEEITRPKSWGYATDFEELLQGPRSRLSSNRYAYR